MSEPIHYPVSIEIPVAWGEMDAFGHVNNVIYFRYFESARIEYMNAILDNQVTTDDFAPILASTECRYLRPVVYPDTLTAQAAITKVGNSSFTMAYCLRSAKQQTVVAEGGAVVVNVNPATGKGVPLSDAFRARVAELQSG